MLEINHLSVRVESKEILHDLSFTIPKGKVHAIMGPNGSGKSTLANTLMGHPIYTITNGKIRIDGEDITDAKPHQRAKKGLFLSQQYVPEIPGVTVNRFLRAAIESKEGKKQHPVKFFQRLTARMKDLHMDTSFASRELYVGFSGGEKKRLEILQLLLLNPMYAILDETDSGLDVDALKVVAEGINTFRSKDKGILLITHYSRLLEYVIPDVVHMMMGGSIVKNGGAEMARQIDTDGYTT